MVNFAEPPEASTSTTPIDTVTSYARLLESGRLTMPVAAVHVLADVIARSTAQTMSQLLEEVNASATELKSAATNPISLSAGTALLLRFVTLQSPAPGRSFDAHKQDLANRARDFVRASPRCAELIAQGAFATSDSGH
jgi:translation initiation factor eIF-2B subunit alpha